MLNKHSQYQLLREVGRWVREIANRLMQVVGKSLSLLLACEANNLLL